SAELAAAVERLRDVPQSLGDWQGSAQTFDEAGLRQSGIKGHAAYKYRNSISHEELSMLIVCGRPGPISVHTPDVCYGGAGYRPSSDRHKKQVALADGRTVSVWTQRFKLPANMGSSEIEVCWVWNGGDGWMAPESSRWKFSGCAALYKLYLVRELST